jgi:hypothetical protein
VPAGFQQLAIRGEFVFNHTAPDPASPAPIQALSSAPGAKYFLVARDLALNILPFILKFDII